MAKAQKRYKNFAPAAEAAAKLLSPILQKKAGLNMRLVENWTEIAGADIAASVWPLKIVWPRQTGAELRAGGLRAGLLVIGCFGFAAVRAQHKTAEIIARINRFFGYRAIDRIKIEQKNPPAAVFAPRQKRTSGSLLGAFDSGLAAPPRAEAEVPAAIKRRAETIEDEALRAALLRLGANLRR